MELALQRAFNDTRARTRVMRLPILLLTWVVAQLPPATALNQNLNSCVKGLLDCDLASLTPSELREVAKASQKRNLDKCLEGSPGCDPSRLTNEEAARVDHAARQRNFDKCLTGSSACDPTRLDEAGATKVKAEDGR